MRPLPSFPPKKPFHALRPASQTRLVATRKLIGSDDIHAALTHLAETILARHPSPARLIVLGIANGGIALARRLADRLGVPVEPVEAIGFDGDAIEAQWFAYLALRSRRGLPLSFPTTTGAPAPMTGGVFWPCSRGP